MYIIKDDKNKKYIKDWIKTRDEKIKTIGCIAINWTSNKDKACRFHDGYEVYGIYLALGFEQTSKDYVHIYDENNERNPIIFSIPKVESKCDDCIHSMDPRCEEPCKSCDHFSEFKEL